MFEKCDNQTIKEHCVLLFWRITLRQWHNECLFFVCFEFPNWSYYTQSFDEFHQSRPIIKHHRNTQRRKMYRCFGNIKPKPDPKRKSSVSDLPYRQRNGMVVNGDGNLPCKVNIQMWPCKSFSRRIQPGTADIPKPESSKTTRINLPPSRRIDWEIRIFFFSKFSYWCFFLFTESRLGASGPFRSRPRRSPTRFWRKKK